MQLYLDQFHAKYDFDGGVKPCKFIVIATTARSGSHMLGHAMRASGRLGFPLEYANPSNLKEWETLLQAQGFENVIEKLKNRRTSPNGVFSLKIHYSQLLRLGGFGEVQRIFPDSKYILLSRKNVVKQAVSYAIALQTGVWIEGQEGSRKSPRYDFALIDRCLKEILGDTAAWRYILNASGSDFLELEFEGVVSDMGSALNKVCSFAGVSGSDSIAGDPLVTHSQSGTRNQEWVDRFVKDHAGRFLYK